MSITKSEMVNFNLQFEMEQELLARFNQLETEKQQLLKAAERIEEIEMRQSAIQTELARYRSLRAPTAIKMKEQGKAARAAEEANDKDQRGETGT